MCCRDKIKKVSQAAYGLCCWCRAMETYNRVAKVGLSGSRMTAEVFSDLVVVLYNGFHLYQQRPALCLRPYSLPPTLLLPTALALSLDPTPCPLLHPASSH